MNQALQGKVDVSGVVQQTLWEAHQRLQQELTAQTDLAALLRRLLANNLVDEVRKAQAGKRDVRRERSLEEELQASSATIRQWQVSSGPMHWRCDDQLLKTGWLTWRPNSRQWATIGPDGLVKIWDNRSDQELFTLPGIGRAIAFSPDGWRLAATQENAEVVIWDARPRFRNPSTSADD